MELVKLTEIIVKELVKDKGKLIKFTKEYLENYVLDILNKVKDMVYMVTD